MEDEKQQQDSEELEKILESADLKSVLDNQKKLIWSKFLKDSTLYYAGGTFRITPELLVYVSKVLMDIDNKGVVVDDNNRPVMIYDLQDFYDQILSTYREAVHEYFFEYEKLRKKRKVTTAVRGD